MSYSIGLPCLCFELSYVLISFGNVFLNLSIALFLYDTA